jgi:Rhodopirellula transposase DDE domain
LIGNFFRSGKLYTKAVIETYDHDWPSAASGKAIPHGLYDLKRNAGFVTIGNSYDTSELAYDSLLWWWQNDGRYDYPDATSLLLLCDGGGSNRANTWLFKYDLARFAQATGLTVRVAHYPPYCSKYNPIEHRLFPHLTRACQGVIFTSTALVKELMEKTTTKKGLTVTVQILDKVYQLGRTLTEEVKTQIQVAFAAVLPKWNYTVAPNPA